MNGTARPVLRGTRPGTVLVPQGALVRGPAFLVDTFLVSAVATLFLRSGQATLSTMVLTMMTAELIYFAVSEGVFGTTLGKRLFGLRVVRASDGRACGPVAAIVRTLLRVVDNILFSLPGIAAMVSSPQRQRFGDRAAKTLVVSEVPEQLLKVFGGLRGGVDAEEMFKRLRDLTGQRPTGVPVQPAGAEEELVPCPFCAEPMSPEEIVCGHCDHYVNQMSAHGETEHLAPIPELYSGERNYRFDALWRLVFAADEQSLEAAREAIPAWPRADRLLAVHMFSEVADARPAAFLDFMTHDADPAVKAMARDVRAGLISPDATR